MTILIKLQVSSYIISIFLELFIWESWGGVKAVWEFSKKTSILGNPVTPEAKNAKSEIPSVVLGAFDKSQWKIPE